MARKSTETSNKSDPKGKRSARLEKNPEESLSPEKPAKRSTSARKSSSGHAKSAASKSGSPKGSAARERAGRDTQEKGAGKGAGKKKTTTKRRTTRAKSNPPAVTKPKTDCATRQKPGDNSKDERMSAKTHLSDKELQEFRELLLEKRRQLVGMVADMEQEAMRSSASSGGQSSSMPIHMADLGSDTWEQEFTLGLIANERQTLTEIDQALERIKDKTYGLCVATGKPISKARLKAKPWALYCIAYAREREARGG